MRILIITQKDSLTRQQRNKSIFNDLLSMVTLRNQICKLFLKKNTVLHRGLRRLLTVLYKIYTVSDSKL